MWLWRLGRLFITMLAGGFRETRRDLPDWYLNNGVTPRRCLVNRRNDPLNHSLHSPPSVPAENHNGDLPALEVLLIGNVVVSGKQQLEARFFGNSQETSIR